MGKINIISSLKNVTENKVFSNECKGIKNNNKIKFIDNNITVIITLNDDEIEIYRKSNEYEIIIPISFNKKVGLYKIKGLGSLNLEVIAEKINIEENIIEIIYSMIIDSSTPQKFKYYIKYDNL